MRLYSGRIGAIGSELIRKLKESGDIEVNDPKEAQLDIEAVLKEFLTGVKARFERVVFEPAPGWDPDECDDLTHDLGALSARDPLIAGLSKLKVAYYRLHGPAGHKSRYEDPAIERLAEIASAAKHTDATYVFTNVDMFADAKRFKKALKI